MNNLKSYLPYIGIGLLGILIGAFFFGGNGEEPTNNKPLAEQHDHASEEEIYTCSMHPQIRQSEPGNCPICGMELIPAEDSVEPSNPNALVMTQAAMKLAEIETSPVISEIPEVTLTLPGKVEADRSKVSAVTALFKGRIVDLYIDFEGAYVKKGQKIASIYSPELIAAQRELLESARIKDKNPVLYEAAKRKLANWNLPEATIREIENSGEVKNELDIVSPATGFITKLNIDRQEYVNAGTQLFKVADLSTVWVMFDAFESNISVIRKGQNIRFTAPSSPGVTYRGTVDYVDPTLQGSSRSIKVRVEADNPDYKLKPNMLAEGTLKAGVSASKQLLVPKSAILWTGKRSVVFVQDPDSEEPTFTAREITLGPRAGSYYVVEEGLEKGEQVVTNGTFKLDSAAQLADKKSMMNREPDKGNDQTGEPEHSMNSMESSLPEEEIVAIPDAFKSEIKLVVNAYLNLKNSLVRTDAESTKSNAKEMSAVLSGVDMNLIKGDTHMEWMEYQKLISEQTELISNSDDNEVQRTAFIKLSEALIQTVKSFRVPGVIYEQFCPMADGGKGAYWLSEKESIENPYFGDMMLTCGETISKIEN